MHALVVLDKVRPLRNNLHTDIQLIGLASHAQHGLGGMGIVLILRIAAQVGVAIVFVRPTTQQRQLVVPAAILGSDAEEVESQLAEVVGAAVALRVLIFILVRELQVGLGEDRLAVRSLHAVVPVLRRRHGVAVGQVVGLGTVVIHRIVGERTAHALTVVARQSQGDVAPRAAQSAIDL